MGDKFDDPSAESGTMQSPRAIADRIEVGEAVVGTARQTKDIALELLKYGLLEQAKKPNLYRSAVLQVRFGYASALAWILFVLLLTMTLLIVRSGRRWVYEEGRRFD